MRKVEFPEGFLGLRLFSYRLVEICSLFWTIPLSRRFRDVVVGKQDARSSSTSIEDSLLDPVPFTTLSNQHPRQALRIWKYLANSVDLDPALRRLLSSSPLRLRFDPFSILGASFDHQATEQRKWKVRRYRKAISY